MTTPLRFGLPLLFALAACASESAGGGGGGADTTGGDAGAAIMNLVFNEISARTTADGTAQDWVELYNAGDADAELTGLAIADEATNGCIGLPQTAHSAPFPTGTRVAPGDFLLIVGNRDTSTAGFQTDCLPDGPAECLHVSWGIRKSKGESLFILDATGDVLLEECYPPGALEGAPTDVAQTWGRVPDGSGQFTITAPTPGAPNVAR